MTYYAIIGDVKDSKTLSNRNDVQEKIKNILDNVNRIHSNEIAAQEIIQCQQLMILVFFGV